MITDKIQLAGPEAYFQNPNNGSLNLDATSNPIASRIPAIPHGKQEEISGLQIFIEGDDLTPLFQMQAKPLFTVTLSKEMFAGLFADPFRHRVHNIAGNMDFNEGIFENTKVMEIDGIPTIVSTGGKNCTWTSKRYELPEPINIDALAWELATSKLSPPDSFSYKVEVACFDTNETLVDTISTGTNLIHADAQRFKEKTVAKTKFFQVTFRAIVNQDSYVSERQLPVLNVKMGRPLLRAINILEVLDYSAFDIFSLTELQTQSSYYKTFETSDLAVKSIIATLDFKVVLVRSEREDIPNNKYEFVEVNVLTNSFRQFEIKRNSTISFKNISA